MNALFFQVKWFMIARLSKEGEAFYDAGKNIPAGKAIFEFLATV